MAGSYNKTIKQGVRLHEKAPKFELPKWLDGIGANFIIAGGMGQRAHQLFAQDQIKVVVGAFADDPEILVSGYLKKTLVSGDNICDH